MVHSAQRSAQEVTTFRSQDKWAGYTFTYADEEFAYNKLY